MLHKMSLSLENVYLDISTKAQWNLIPIVNLF